MSICWTRIIDEHFAAPARITPPRLARDDMDAVPPLRSMSPRWRTVGLLSVASDLRRVSSAGWPSRTPKAVGRQPAVPSMRSALDALERVHQRVTG